MMRPVARWLGLAGVTLALMLASCGGGKGGSEAPAPDPDANAPAVEKLAFVDRIAGIPAPDVAVDAVGARVALTELEIGFARTTTVAELEALLASIDGRVVFSLPKVAIVLVRIPNPGSLAALQAIVAKLQADPRVRFVRRGYFAGRDGLPGNVEPRDLSYIGHHLAVRGAAAWTFNPLLQSVLPPTLVIADYFGGGEPLLDYGILLSVDSSFGVDSPNPHGYHVLGIAAASFGGAETPRGQITGMYPGVLNVSAIDLVKELPAGLPAELTMPAIESAILARLVGISGRAVVNTSLPFPCDSQERVELFCTLAHATVEGLAWVEKVRDGGFEDRTIHVTSAGNVNGFNLNTVAAYNSSFAAARLLVGSLPTAQRVEPLRNTLVIENVIAKGAPAQPRCLSDDSKTRGDLAAIGTDVWSLTGVVNGLELKSGTSMATPQVAGLAAYVWALNPLLSNVDVIERLRRTAQTVVPDAAADPQCSAAAPAPVIDAYAAVLAGDADLAHARLRGKLLDVSDGSGQPGEDGRFDEKDVKLLFDVLGISSGVLDYSRHDLNGDGRTGGNGLARFDLDLDRGFSPTTLAIYGHDVRFNEAELTDLEVLCYYAYSGLYAGDLPERDELLLMPCTRTSVSLVIGNWLEFLDLSLLPVGGLPGVTAYAGGVEQTDGVVPRLWLNAACEVTEGLQIDPGSGHEYRATAQGRNPANLASSHLRARAANDGMSVALEFGASMNALEDDEARTSIRDRYVNVFVEVGTASSLEVSWRVVSQATSSCIDDGNGCATSHVTADIHGPLIMRLTKEADRCRPRVAYQAQWPFGMWTGGSGSFFGGGPVSHDQSEQLVIPLEPGRYQLMFLLDITSDAYGAHTAVSAGGALAGTIDLRIMQR